MPPATAPSRRERLRTEALAEIREHGYAQIAEGGPTALSLNGIAKAMGMSGPALYRYFASRDELLVTLVTESYEDLAGTLGEAARRARGGEPQERLRAALDACRQWALAQPHRYRLVFARSSAPGALAPPRTLPAAQRSMSVVLAAVAELGPSDQAPAVPDDILRHQLAAWGNRSSDHSHLERTLLLLGARRVDPDARHHQLGDRRLLRPSRRRSRPPLPLRDRSPHRRTIWGLTLQGWGTRSLDKESPTSG